MLGVLLSIKRQCMKSEKQYKANFYLMVLAGIITNAASLGVPFILFHNIPSISGWSSNEIYLIMVYIIIAEGLNSVLVEGAWTIPEMVFSGKLDMLLIRPESPLLQILCYGVGIHGIGNLIFGIPALIYLQVTMNLTRPIDIMLSILSVICGTVICLSINLIFNSVAFWIDTGGSTSIPYAISNLIQYARYPITIYPLAMQIILCFVVPCAFMGMIPAMIITGKVSVIYAVVVIMIAALFMGLAVLVFNKGITKYESAGM